MASVRRQLVWWRQDRALGREGDDAEETAEAMIHPVISGAAEDVRLADLGEVHHSIGVVLLATDGSEPAACATRYAILLAKLFDAKLRAVYVDTGLEDVDLPEESCLDEACRASIPASKASSGLSSSPGSTMSHAPSRSSRGVSRAES